MTSPFDLFDQPAEESEGFKALPEGAYQVEIEEALIDEGGKWGPQLKYTLKVCEETGYKNRKIWVNRKLTSETMWKVRKDLNALGYSDVSSKNVSTVLESLLGKTVTVDVKYAENKNNPAKPYQNVDFHEVATSSSGEGIPF